MVVGALMALFMALMVLVGAMSALAFVFAVGRALP